MADMRNVKKGEMMLTMTAQSEEKIPGGDWNFSENIRDNVMEDLSGIKGDNSLQIFGPDIDKLEELAARAQTILSGIRGIENVGIFHIRGQSHLEFRVDPEKCQRWGVQTADVNNVISSALGAKPQSSMIEGEKLFDIAIRWPKWRRDSVTSILDIPVDIINNTVVLPQGPGAVPLSKGFAVADPSKSGTLADTSNPISQQAPRLCLRDVVSPVGDDGSADRNGEFERQGASTIYRENGKREIAIKFSVRGRDLGSSVAEAQEKTRELFQAPYRPEWGGEFQEMEEAESRLILLVSLALALIVLLLYLAFRSLLDAAVVLSNVLAMSLGGIWALFITRTNFNISAAVGFISILGVAVMNGLLLVSAFNRGRAQGAPVYQAVFQGVEKLIRPITMTALAAIFGLLPAALSTAIGSETQRPLAIVVVGGMVTTLLSANLVPILYTFYGHREPREEAASLAH